MTKTFFSSCLYAVIFLTACTPTPKKYTPPTSLSTYLECNYSAEQNVSTLLTSYGFTLLYEQPVENSNEIVWVTHPSLKSYALRKDKSFIANSLRIFVDTNKSTLFITNPEYFVKAYLGDSYMLGDGVKIRKIVQNIFKGCTYGTEKVAFKRLENYTFMAGMPTYKGSIVLFKAKTLEEIWSRLNVRKNKDKIKFRYKLAQNRYIIGVDLLEISKNIVKHLGDRYALIFPFTLVVEPNAHHEFEVKLLDPKYQIALFYPSLDLTSFFPIIALPDQIEKALKMLFKEVK